MQEEVEGGKVEIRVANYGKKELFDGKLILEVVAATYIDKGEDRHTVYTGSNEMEECQGDWKVPRMVGYVAVLDGHDGPNASEYCSKGLLPHILAETEYCLRTGKKKVMDGSAISCSVDAGIMNAFHRAQARFAANCEPPTFEEVKENTTRGDNGLLARMRRIRKPRPRGGTAALTLSLYGEYHGDECRIIPHVIVANCGDCRLLTDDGTGTTFRQVTTDHRPADPNEYNRLVRHARRGGCILAREVDSNVIRIFPGGLALSRSIGDLRASKAVTCTPDIFRVPLHVQGDQRRTQRFIMGSDGLWDVIPNDEVHKFAARVVSPTKSNQPASDETRDDDLNADAGDELGTTAKQAVIRLIEQCLKDGGIVDDVTILVVDVTYTGKESR